MLELHRITWHNWKIPERHEMVVIGNLFDAMLMLKNQMKVGKTEPMLTNLHTHELNYHHRGLVEGFIIEVDDYNFIRVSRTDGFWNIYE